jgi:hypothetical protein
MSGETVNTTEKKYTEEFAYLDHLRRSGVTNMFGAAKYLERDFNMDRREAKEVLLAWMGNFGRKG